MIPNAGLDNAAAYPPFHYVSGSSSPTSGAEWMGYAAIGEDSQAPLATDVNIGAEKARTNSTGGFNHSTTTIRDPNTNRLGLSIERVYVFDISSEMNITKYGYVPVSSGGNFSWIDLVRSDPNDPQSQPIALTLEPGDQLQLWRTLTITVPWSVDLEPFTVTGALGKDDAGTYDAHCGFYSTHDELGSVSNNVLSANGDGIGTLILDIFWPARGELMRTVATPQAARTARDQTLAASVSGSEQGQSPELAPYVSGAYFRDKILTFTTAQGNMAITGIAVNRTASAGSATATHGFKVVFDDPGTFVKANTHQLSLTFRVSWQEA